MIQLHDGNCQPFNIFRKAGRDTRSKAWDLENGQLLRANTPVLAWRTAKEIRVLADRGELHPLFEAALDALLGEQN